jgi:2-succinyl-6-hydroxy-2,4-cyclohexadiene-1-carboxylate synthase
VTTVTNDGSLSMLHAEVDGHGPRIVLVHGFAQNRNCWGPIAPELAADHEVVRVDAPGHGLSSDFYAGLRTGARLIADQGGPATYIGYSMGARFVLHLALANPELVHGLVLIGGTAGIDDDTARAERQRVDAAMADRLERDGLDAFVDAWLAQPLFAGLSEEMQFRTARKENTIDGLSESLRQAGTGSQDPLWPRLSRLEMPALVVAGADDAKFRAEAERLGSSIGANAIVTLIEHAGHAAHLEQPDAFLALLRDWLATYNL